MVLLTGILVWIVAVVLLVRLVKIAIDFSQVSKSGVALWFVLVAGAAVLLFRPHEVILGGQDPGVYLNTAAAFARHNSIFSKDEMLAQVPVEDRTFFLFGHRGYGFTKDSCLAIRNFNTAEVGPRFPPLFAVFLSVPARLADPGWMLYVVPLIALFAAVAMGVLGRLLIGRPWAGVLAFVFYLAMPLVAWHARAPRPEVVAGFLFLGGCALVINAWRTPCWRNWFDILLGAGCIALAPFFHVTAWFLAVAFAVPVGLAILAGRYDLLLYVPLSLGGLAGLVFQTFRITDHYGLRRFMEPLAKYWFVVVAALAVLVAVLAAVSIFVAGRVKKAVPGSDVTTRRWTAVVRVFQIAFAAAMLCGFLVLFMRSVPIAARNQIEPAYHYAYPTDMRVVVEFVSVPVLLVALAGMLYLMLLRSPGVAGRLALVFSLLPACWLIGNMYDLFMTRYMLTGIVPLVALGLASAVMALAAGSRLGKLAAGAAVAVLLAWQAAFGWHLAITTEYRGLTKFLRGFAGEIDRANGMLLCEYSRVGAPLDHMFGIRTLSLDNETRNSYSKAIDAWLGMMQSNPDKRAFFMTPFQAPVSDLFDLRPVRTETIQYPRLRSELFRLPHKAGIGDMSLNLYEMVLRRGVEMKLPFVRSLDPGNMGLKGFGGERSRQWEVHGVEVSPGNNARIQLDKPAGRDGDWGLVLVFMNRSGDVKPAMPVVGVNGGAEKVAHTSWERLAGNWWVLVAGGSAGDSVTSLEVSAACELILTDVTLDATTGRVSLKPAGAAGKSRAVKTDPWSGRSAGSSCGFLAPVPSTGDAWLLVLAQARKESAGPASIAIRQANHAVMESSLQPGEWTWLAARIKPRSVASGTIWFNAQIVGTPAPEQCKSDEPGVRFACIAVVPEPSGPVLPGR